MVVVVVERRRVRSSESGGGGGFWRERRTIRDISTRVLHFQHWVVSELSFVVASL